MFGNQKGQTLIQVILASALMLILLVSFTNFISTQLKSVESLKEKLAVMDFEQQLIRSFSDGTICSTLAVGRHFDSAAAKPGSTNLPSIAIPVSSIPISSAPGAPPLATAGGKLSSLTNSLMVQSAGAASSPFQLRNISGSSLGGTGNYSAEFQVNLDQSKAAASLRPPSVQVTLTTTSVGTTETITACGKSGLQVRSGQVAHGATIPSIPGIPKANCQVMMSMEDSHLGPAYTNDGGDFGMWGDNHYGGSQAFYDKTTWVATCQFYFDFSSTADGKGGFIYVNPLPQWLQGSCSYLMVCTP